MGSSKRVTVGYRYFMGLHFGVCYGPVDSVRRLKVGDRDAFTGNANSNTTVTINQPNLFGGDQREGGIVGDLQVLMGGPTQTLTGRILNALGAGAPAFRRVLSLFYDGQIGSNNPYVKPFSFQVTRIAQGWDGGTAWLPHLADVGVGIGPIEPWLVAPDPRNSLNQHEYRGTATSPWRRNFADAVADAVAAGANSADFTNFIGWSLDGTRLFQAFGVLPTSDILTLHFNRYTITHPSYSYVQYFTPGQYLVCSSFYNATPRVLPQSGRFWWSGLSNATTAEVNNGAGLYRMGGNVSNNDEQPGEQRLNNCNSFTGYPALVGNAYTPVPELCRDGRISVRRIGGGLMNPAHILYQCHTDPDWGMGYPASSIGTSFETAASAFAAEGLGLCLLWNQQDEIGNFVQMVLDHCGANLYEDPSTGKIELKLLRGGYNPASLPVFDPSTIIDLESWQRVGYGDTVNEITVVYRDVATGKDASITVQDLANIQAQGGVVSETRQYPGIPLASLAARIAQRDLIAASTPLAKGRMSVNRNGWSLVAGDVLRLTWPKLGLTNVICRVLAVDYGDLRDSAINVEIAEDVFGLPASSYAAQQPAGWVPPSTGPTVITRQTVVEVPYWTLARQLSAADLSFVDADTAYLAPLAAKPASTAQLYRIWSRVGAAAYEDQNTGEFAPAAVLMSAIDQQATVLLLSAAIDLDQVIVGDLAIIGTGRAAEWVEVTAVNTVTPSITVNRGMLDTTPSRHAIGETVFFTDTANSEDETERATGETVDFRLATIATGGELDYTLATVVSGTAAQRQFRPYPPGDLRINGIGFPVFVETSPVVDWAHRNRLQQTAYLVEQTEGSIGPEAGTTYNAFAYDDASGGVLDSASGLTGTSWSPTLTTGVRLRIEVEAQRDGVTSWQRQIRIFEFLGNARLTEGARLRVSEANLPRIPE